MRTILRGSCALFAVALLGLSTRSLAYNRIEKPLYAGQHILIGKLVVEQIKKTESNRTVKYLRVTYDTTGSDWVMTTTHLYVSKNKPTRAAPGRFPFKHEGLDNVKIDVYEIPLSTLLCSNQELYIAAHADVCEILTGSSACTPDFASAAASLPSVLSNMTVSWNYVNSYFDVHTTFGTFPAWCLDYDGPIGIVETYGTVYHLSVLSDGSVNPIAEALLGSQSAIAMSGSPINHLNYLMNRPYVRDCGNGGPYSFVDIQVAIWVLTNGLSPSAYGASLANVTAILNDVIANGAGFVPSCGDLVLVVGDPQTPSPGGNPQLHNQHFGFVIPVTGTTVQGDCETAWAKGTVPFSTGWGSYFKYNVW